MITPRFTPVCKKEAVCQITECGYFVAKVSDRLGGSTSSTGGYGVSSLITNAQHARDLLEIQRRDPETTGLAKTHRRRMRNSIRSHGALQGRPTEVPLYQ